MKLTPLQFGRKAYYMIPLDSSVHSELHEFWHIAMHDQKLNRLHNSARFTFRASNAISTSGTSFQVTEVWDAI